MCLNVLKSKEKELQKFMKSILRETKRLGKTENTTKFSKSSYSLDEIENLQEWIEDQGYTCEVYIIKGEGMISLWIQDVH
tara:strand:+ start:1800 stop:2039 length:240 start_codon:yes stop_codon:yes gene_type:complete